MKPPPRNEWIGYLLRIAAVRVNRAANQAFHPLKLDARSYHILYLSTIKERPINQAFISAILEVNQNIVSAIVKELCDRKLLKQLPNHANRREKFLVITPQGQQCLDEATAAGMEVRERLLAKLTPKERTEFTRLLKKFTRDWFIGPA
jgi:DNA-binding MarR family transcriptional regulator